MGLWGRLACVHRAPQVQLRPRLAGYWTVKRSSPHGWGSMEPEGALCDSSPAGLEGLWGQGPVACTPVTERVPQSLWNRRHRGSYRELVTEPP